MLLPADQVRPTKQSALYLYEDVSKDLRVLVIKAYTRACITYIMVVFAEAVFISVLFIEHRHDTSLYKIEILDVFNNDILFAEFF